MTATRIDFGALGLRDALDLAMFVEEEANERYSELAEMFATDRPDTAGFFRKMARAEDAHRSTLLKRRRQNYGDDESVVTRDMIFEVEAPPMSEVHPGMAPLQALQVVLRAEEKAEKFFASALAGVKDGQVKVLFEALRREEAAHQRLVKDEIARLPA